jgi:hypothetical protein
VGVIVANERTIMGLGDVTDYHLWLALIGLCVMGSLMQRQYSAAILVTVLALTILSWIIDSSYPKAIFSKPERSMTTLQFINFEELSVSGLISPVITFLVVGLVDVGGCILGLSAVAGLIEEKPVNQTPTKEPSSHGSESDEAARREAGSQAASEGGQVTSNAGKQLEDSKASEHEDEVMHEGDVGEGNIHIPGTVYAFIGCGVSTVVGALFGGTPTIVVVESAVGIKVGARTGLAACVMGFWFSLAVFLIPFLSHIPNVATAPVTVLLGVMMMSQALLIDWNCLQDAIPAFLTATMIPFTFSVADGIVIGIIAAVMLAILNGDAYKSASQFYIKWIVRDNSREILSYQGLLQSYRRVVRRKGGKSGGVDVEFSDLYSGGQGLGVGHDMEVGDNAGGEIDQRVLATRSYALFENHPHPPVSQTIAEMQFQSALGQIGGLDIISAKRSDSNVSCFTNPRNRSNSDLPALDRSNNSNISGLDRSGHSNSSNNGRLSASPAPDASGGGASLSAVLRSLNSDDDSVGKRN